MISRCFRLIRNLYFDLHYGAFLGGSKKTPYAHLGAKDTMNSDYGVLPWLLNPTVQDGDIFVDVGCGRGRVINFVLHQQRAAKIYGLELDPEVAAEVGSRLRDCATVCVLAGDSADTLPSDATVLYAYNPFSREVMLRFKDRIFLLYGNNGTLGRVKLVYYNAVDVDLFTRDPRCQVTRFELPPGYHPAVLVQFKPFNDSNQ